MIEALSIMAAGFFVATWIGSFLGFLDEYSGKTFVVFMFAIGCVYLFSVLTQGPVEYATNGITWPLVIGSIPGYFVGFPTGASIHERHFTE